MTHRPGTLTTHLRHLLAPFAIAAMLLGLSSNAAAQQGGPGGAPEYSTFPAAQVFTVGTAVNVTLPAASGGDAPLTYTLIPTVPGLTLHPTTRVLTGTPTTAAPLASYFIRAIDVDDETTQINFDITVNAGAPTGLTLSVTPETVTESSDPTTITVTATFVGGTFAVDRVVAFQSTSTGSTATLTTDYTAVPTTLLTIPANMASGSTTFPFTTPVDTDAEPAGETVDITAGLYQSGSTVAFETSFPIAPATLTINDYTPVAVSAGPDQSVAPGATVALAGAVTASDGAPGDIQLAWTLVSENSAFGTALTLAGADPFDAAGAEVNIGNAITAIGNSRSGTFPAPAASLGLTASVPMTIRLTATDSTAPAGQPTTATDDIIITVDPAVNAPAFASGTSISNQRYITGQMITPVTLPAVTTAGPGGTTYTLVPGLPAGLTFTPATRAITGTPTMATTQTLQYTANDGDADMTAGDTATLAFTVMVETDIPPDFGTATIADQSFLIGDTVALTLPGVTGGTGNISIHYTLTPALPAGLTFNDAARPPTITGSPTAAAATAEYTYMTTDGDINTAETDTDMRTFTIAVEADTAPAFADDAMIPEQRYYAGQVLDLTLPQATGGNGALTYTLTGPGGEALATALPGAILNPTTRVLFGTPIIVAARKVFTYTATDADNDAVTLTFNIDVFTDIPPTFGTTTIADMVYRTGTNQESFFLPLPPVTTGSGNINIHYALTPALPAGLVFNAAARAITGLPTAAAAAAVYTYTATDADANTEETDSDSLTFTITVNMAPPQLGFRAEVGIGASPEAVTSVGLFYPLGQPITPVTFPAARGGVPPITYSTEGALPVGLTFDADFRVLSGTPSVVSLLGFSYVATDPPDTPSNFRKLTVNIAICQSGGTADGATPCPLPTFVTLALPTPGEQSFASGATVDLTLPEATAGGFGANPVRIYTATPLPDGLTFDPMTRAITGTPTTAGITTTVNYRVGDAGAGNTDFRSITVTFDIVVTGTDTAPAFADGETIPDQTFTQGTAIMPLTLPTATGGNGPLTYALTNASGGALILPAGLTFDPGTRVLSGTPTEDLSTTILTRFVVTDADANEADDDSARLSFGITLVALDTTTAFADDASIADMVYVIGAVVDQTLPRVTAGNLPLIVSLTPDLPAGLTIESTVASTTIQGTPTAAAPTATYTYTATDDDDDIATLTFSITVEANTAPAFGAGVTISEQTFTQGTAITPLTLPTATGGNGDLTYALIPSAPAGLTFNAATNVLSGTSTDTRSAELVFHWVVTDADSNEATTDSARLSFGVTLVALDIPPAFAAGANISAQTYTAGTAVDLTLPTATGGNDGIVYTLRPDPPAGLTFDADANPPTITGTPTTAAATATHTYTAADGDATTGADDEASLTFSVTVNAPPPPTGFTVAVSPTMVMESATATDITVMVTLTGGGIFTVERAFNVQIMPSTGTGIATPTTDYTPVPDTTLTIPAFATSASLVVPFTAVDDMEVEAGGETLRLTVGLLDISQMNTDDSIGSTKSTDITINDPGTGDTAPAFDVISIPAQNFVTGAAVDLTLPPATGGNDAIVYTLLPAIPGLTLDPSTRVLSGAPTTAAGATNYTYTAADSDANTAAGDQTSLTVSITVRTAVTGFSLTVTDPNSAREVPTLAEGGSLGLTVRARPTPLFSSGFAADQTLTFEFTPPPAARPANAADPYAVYTAVAPGTIAYPVGSTLNPEYMFTLATTDDAFDHADFPVMITVTAQPSGITATTMVTLLDNDIGILTTAATASVVEDATTTYDVQLSEAPPTPVTVTVASQNTATAIVSPATLTFTTTNAQTVTVTGVAAGSTTIRHTAPTASGFSYLTDDVDVTVTDPAPAFASSTPDQIYIAGTAITAVTLPEATGGDGAITHTLTGPNGMDFSELPAGLMYTAADRTITGTPTALTTAPLAFTWTAVDADGNEMSTDTAVDSFTISVETDTAPTFAADASIDNQTYIVGTAITALPLPTATGGNGAITYTLAPAIPGLTLDAATGVLTGTPMTAAAAQYTYTATDTDDDAVMLNFRITVKVMATGFTLSLSDEMTSSVVTELREGGTAVDVRVVATPTPDGSAFAVAQTVTLTVTPPLSARPDNAADPFVPYTTMPGTSSIPAADPFNPFFSLILEVQDDAFDHADLPVTVTATASPSGVTGTATITLLDNDIRITTTAAMASVVESATTTYDVQLSEAPPADTTVTVASQGTATATVSPATLTFTTTNWNTARTVTVTGVAEGSTTISHTAPASGDFTFVTNDVMVTVTPTPTDTDTAPTFGTATVTAQTYTVGTAVDLTLPAATGGNAPYTYTLVPGLLAPPLPDGLTFNAVARTLTGTPTTAAAAADYTYTAADTDMNTAAEDTASLTISITVSAAVVVDSAPTFGGARIPAQVYTVDVPVNLTLPLPTSNIGDAPFTYDLLDSAGTVIPDLSAVIPGLTFTAAARTITGTPTGALVSTNFAYRVSDSDANMAPSDADSLSFSITVNTVEQDTAPTFFVDSFRELIFVVNVPIEPITLPSASGGNVAIVYGLSSPPVGLNFEPSTRVLSGTPTEVRVRTIYGYSVRDTDANSAGDDADTLLLGITVTARAGNLVPAFADGASIATQNYIVGSPITPLTLPVATGGDGTLVYSLRHTGANTAVITDLSTVIPGLTLDIAARTITGTPTTASGAAINYTWNAEDTDNDLINLTFGISVLANAVPTFDTGSQRIANQAYFAGQTVLVTLPPTATSGNGPTMYTLTPALPDGLTFNSNPNIRTITGMPTTETASAEYTYTAGDSDSNTLPADEASLMFTVTVTGETAGTAPSFGTATDEPRTYIAGLAIEPLTLPVATGGDGAITYTLTGPSNAALNTAVPGLTFDAATRTLSGTPTTVAASTDLTYTAGDTDGSAPGTDEVTLTLSITIEAGTGTAPPTFGGATVSPQAYFVGTAIMSLTLPVATGGTGAITYTLTPALPTGLIFNATARTITGTASAAAGATDYTYTATDGDMNTATLMFSITIDAMDTAPAFAGSASITAQTYMVNTAIMPLTLPAVTDGTGNGAITYTLSPAIPGLTLNPTSRVLTGTPTTVPTVTMYTYTAADSDGTTGAGDEDTLTFSITVMQAPPSAIRLSVNPAEVTESSDATDITLTATLIGGMFTAEQTITFASTDGTATAGTDYTAVGNTVLTIPANMASGTMTFSFTATVDEVAEPGGETVLFGMGAVVEMITVTPATLTINDYDLVVNAGDDQTVASGGTITLNGEVTGSTDTTTAWALSDSAATRAALEAAGLTTAEATTEVGRLTTALAGTGPDRTFPAPAANLGLTDPVALAFTLTVTDNDPPGGQDAATAMDTVTITVEANTTAVTTTLNEAILPEVTRALVHSTSSSITRRVGQAVGSIPVPTAGSFNLAGQQMGGERNLAAALRTHGEAMSEDSRDIKEILAGSDFVLPLNAGGAGIDTSSVAFWGSGEYRDFSGESDDLDWDGDLLGFQLGLDARLRNNLLVGVAVSMLETDVDYQDDTGILGQGDYELDLTSAHPYIGWRADELDLWATVGYGTGDLEITGQGETPQSGDVNLQTIGGGGSGMLWQDGTTTLRLKAEVSQTQLEVKGSDDFAKQEIDATGIRIAVEATRPRTLDGGGIFEPSVEVAARHDGGDGETGGGAEVGGALRYRNPATGLTADGRIRALMGQGGNYEEWGISGTVRVAPGTDGQGLSFSLSPGYGDSGSGIQELWRHGLVDETSTATTDDYAMKLDARIGYGLGFTLNQHHGILTPYSELTYGTTDSYRMGLNWAAGTRFDLTLLGERREPGTNPAEHAVLLKGEVRF